jgi:hypothetical protein
VIALDRVFIQLDLSGHAGVRWVASLEMPYGRL